MSDKYSYKGGWQDPKFRNTLIYKYNPEYPTIIKKDEEISEVERLTRQLDDLVEFYGTNTGHTEEVREMIDEQMELIESLKFSKDKNGYEW